MYARHIAYILTPISETNITTGKITSSNSCASMLGLMKSACDVHGQLVAQGTYSQQYSACLDPRYNNWLVNDYGTYPAGTWDYVTDQCYMTLHGKYCPPGGPKMVRP